MIKDEVLDIVLLMDEYETFTVRAMAQALNVSNVSIRNAIAELIKKKYLKKQGTGNNIEYVVQPLASRHFMEDMA